MMNDRTIHILLAGFLGALLVGAVVIPTQPFSGALAGHALGIAGGIIMSLTLIYPFRKRVLKKKGKLNPLSSHVFFGLAGPTLVVLHAGNNPASLIGILTYFSMLLVVLSGIVGRFLFKKVNRSLKEQKGDLERLRALLDRKRNEVGARELETFLEAKASFFANGEECRACEELRDVALSVAETEHSIAVFDRAKLMFKRWSMAHLYLTAVLFAMLAVHILVTTYYGLRWLP